MLPAHKGTRGDDACPLANAVGLGWTHCLHGLPNFYLLEILSNFLGRKLPANLFEKFAGKVLLKDPVDRGLQELMRLTGWCKAH